MFDQSLKLSLIKPCSVVDAYNIIKMLCKSNFMVQPEATSGELVDLLNTRLNLEERCDEAVIDVVMKNEDDNNFTARKSLKLIVWLLQSTLVANDAWEV